MVEKKLTNSLLTKKNENLLFNIFDETLKPQVEELLSIGKSAGADLVEIFLEKSDNISILAEQEDISNVSPSFGIGAGIRVFLEKKDGFVSTNDLSREGLLFALNQALGMLGLSTRSKNRKKFDKWYDSQNNFFDFPDFHCKKSFKSQRFF